MKLRKTITAAAYIGDIKITVALDSDGLTRDEARDKFDALTGELMRTLSDAAREPLSRIKLR